MAHRFEVRIDGEDIELTVDNHGIAMFRDEPEKDYLDITHYVGEEEAHTLIFRQRWVLLWMGRVATQEGDAEAIDELDAANGSFSGTYGWNSPVMVEDSPAPFEDEMYTQFLLKDLEHSVGLPDDFVGDERDGS